MLNGPGGMGGAINLVSRKPTKEVELEGRVGTVFSGDLDSMNSSGAPTPTPARARRATTRSSAAPCSTRTTGTCRTTSRPSRWRTRTAASAAIPNTEDWRINTKVGLTPNATDEYSINYTVQQGEKSAPLHVAGSACRARGIWDWPYWDTSSISWLSKTQIGSALLFQEQRLLQHLQEPAQLVHRRHLHHRRTRNSQDFNSYYDDYAYGGFVEAGTNLIPMNTLKGAIHYRRDGHSERSDIAPDKSPIQPRRCTSPGRTASSTRGRSPWRTRSTRRATSTS